MDWARIAWKLSQCLDETLEEWKVAQESLGISINSQLISKEVLGSKGQSLGVGGQQWFLAASTAAVWSQGQTHTVWAPFCREEK